MTYTRLPRYAGKTKYPLRKMIKFAFDGIVSFSSAPLRLALRFGFILSALSIAAAIGAIVLKLAGAWEVPGWTSVPHPSTRGWTSSVNATVCATRAFHRRADDNSAAGCQGEVNID